MSVVSVLTVRQHRLRIVTYDRVFTESPLVYQKSAQAADSDAEWNEDLSGVPQEDDTSPCKTYDDCTGRANKQCVATAGAHSVSR